MANKIHETRSNEGEDRSATETASRQRVDRDSQKADATADGFYEEIRIEIGREDDTATP